MEIKHPNVVVGKGTLYNKNISIIPPKEGVVFGNFCAIGPNLTIMGTNHDYNYPAVQYTFHRRYFNSDHPGLFNKTKLYSKGKIIIGSDVWFGNDVVVMSGVKIGDGCCIGARSVVTKDLDPYTICVGTPCRAIKKRYSDQIIEYLLELKWWLWEDDKIKQNKTFFQTNLNELSLDQIKSLIN